MSQCYSTACVYCPRYAPTNVAKATKMYMFAKTGIALSVVLSFQLQQHGRPKLLFVAASNLVLAFKITRENLSMKCASNFQLLFSHWTFVNTPCHLSV